jgi:nitroreductase
MTQSPLDLLLTRRSVKLLHLTEPGPSAAELDTILTAAARVPDHKRLVPWRFIVFEGDARARFGAVLADVCAAEETTPPPSAARLDMERTRLLRAPIVIAAVSRVVPTPGVPEIEQMLSCGAACQNLVLAANAIGYGTCWVTEWYAFNARIAKVLGLADNEHVAGFIYIGTATERQPDRDRPQLSDIVTRWNG